MSNHMPNPMVVVVVGTIACCCATTAAAASSSVPKQPHIAFILADDWGQYNAGYRGDASARTPAIDALAGQGLVLERFYVHKWCAPTRSALMTGRNPIHTGLDPLNWTKTIMRPGMGDSAVHKDYIFLPRLLQAAGYQGHMLGKWHLGSFLQDFTPVGRGFNTSFGFLGGFETYDTHMMWNGRWNVSREATGVPNGGYVGPWITDLYDSDHAATDIRYNGTCNTAGVCTCSDGNSTSNICRYSSYMYTEKALELIGTLAAEVKSSQPGGATADVHAGSSSSISRGGTGGGSGGSSGGGGGTGSGKVKGAVQPQFFYFAVQSVHSPYQISKEYLDRFPHLPVDGVARRMHAMVAALDDFVGNTTAAIKAGELWDNTLIILHADNGGCQAAAKGPGRWHDPTGRGGIQDAGGTAYPYRGAKFNVWEGGTRTPAILSGGFLPPVCAGRESFALMHVSDWLATLASVAGVPEAELTKANATGPKPLDSFNMAPLLLGGTCGASRAGSPRTKMLYFYGDDHNGAYVNHTVYIKYTPKHC